MALSQSQPQLNHSTHSQLPELSPPQRISSRTPSPQKTKISVELRSPPLPTDVVAAAPATSTRHSNHSKYPSSSSPSKQTRSGLFSFAALAREKTSNALANLSEPSIRSQRSSNSLYHSAQSSPTTSTLSLNTAHSPTSIDSLIVSNEPQLYEPQLANRLIRPRISHTRSETLNSTASCQSLLEDTDPPSQAYTNTASNTTPPVVQAPVGQQNKMHQTSSRLLRMTTDDRPFTRVSH
jgi:hypothetical protein